MRPLILSDIESQEDYARARDEFRRRVIALKKVRRVEVGPRIAVVFENRETMRFQVQEMCRIEHITEPGLVQRELDVYNDLLPEGHAIGATLLIALDQSDDMPTILRELSGVEEHVFMEGEGFRIHALAEPGKSTEEKTSAVHYLTFPFTTAQINLMADSATVSLAVHHPGYDYRVGLDKKAKGSLLGDLIH